MTDIAGSTVLRKFQLVLASEDENEKNPQNQRFEDFQI